MGLFSRNENTNLGTNYDVPADESYTYPTGFGRILSESAQNDLNLFSALIARDFEEAALIQEGYGGFSEEVITEGVGDIFKKIKEIFLKLLAKIKGIFKSFLAKFDSVVIKDNRKYFEKYKPVVNGAGINWSNFECKFQKPKDSGIQGYNLDLGYHAWNQMQLKLGTPETFESKKIDDLTEDDAAYIEFLNKTGTSISEASDFDKEFHEMFYEDEEMSDDYNAMKRYAEPILYAGDKYAQDLKKNLENLDSGVRKILKQIDKEPEASLKYTPKTVLDKETDDNKTITKVDRNVRNNSDLKNPEFTTNGTNVTVGKLKGDTEGKYLQFANAESTLAQIFERAVTKVHSAVLTEIKFETKQARSIYAAMVAYALKGKNKVANESADSLPIIAQEAAEYEFESDFELA